RRDQRGEVHRVAGGYVEEVQQRGLVCHQLAIMLAHDIRMVSSVLSSATSCGSSSATPARLWNSPQIEWMWEALSEKLYRTKGSNFTTRSPRSSRPIRPLARIRFSAWRMPGNENSFVRLVVIVK